MKIGIDMGHGGINPITGKYVTPGKRSPNPVDGEVFYEGVNNRRFGKAWGEALEREGNEVVYITDPNDYKDINLTTRVRIANAHNLDFLISIHSNGATDKRARGHEVFTSIGHTASDIFADIWGEEWKEEFPELKYRHGKQGANGKEALFTIIAGNRHVTPNYEALLVELEFHTNDDAVRLMRTDEFLNRTIKVLLHTVRAYKVK